MLDRTDGTFISAEACVPVNWASRVDPATGRPVEVPGARYSEAVQLIAPSAHGGHNWHPMAFKLGGAAELPQPAVTHVNIPEPPAIDATPEVIASGELFYHTWCSSCHGAGATSGSALPDLKYLSAGAHARWESIMRDGAYASLGMPGFDHVLSETDSAAVEAFPGFFGVSPGLSKSS